MKIKSENPAKYSTASTQEDDVIENARSILRARLMRETDALSNPNAVLDYLQVKLAGLPHEVFACLMLDNRNRVIAFRELFLGTIDSTSVYPREVVKQALLDNAASVILTHNHPSGIAEPSQADIQITERLKKALALVDIRVLDHIVIGGVDKKDCTSFREQGRI